MAVARTATGQSPRDLAGPVVGCDEQCLFGRNPDGDNVVAEDRPFYWDNGQDAVEVGYWPADDDLTGRLAQAQDRLIAAGWTIDPVTFAAFDGEFAAHRADLSVRVWTIPGARRVPDPGDDFLVTAPAVLMVQHTAPSGLNLFSRTGFLAGLIIGWLLTAPGGPAWPRASGPPARPPCC